MSEPRTIVLTGVSRGLGRAMLEELVRQGHRIAGCARSASSIEQLQADFPDQHFTSVDTADDAAVGQWAAEVCNTVGVPDLLLNNAALINENAELWRVAPEEFSQVVDVNIKGVFHVIRHFVPRMIEQGQGIIVNFSSGWGRSTSPEVAPYCATKFAIEGMSLALAQELPGGMASIPLNPGIIDTDMLQSCFGASASSFPNPEQWAQKAVPYILGLSPRHNGQSLSVA